MTIHWQFHNGQATTLASSRWVPVGYYESLDPHITRQWLPVTHYTTKLGCKLSNAWRYTTSAIWPKELLSRRRTHTPEVVVDEATLVYVLHRVLYPQVHLNGIKRKKKL